MTNVAKYSLCTEENFRIFLSDKKYLIFLPQKFAGSKKSDTFASQLRKVAQMAESVDALVSNTSGFTSIPVRPRVWVQIKRLSD